MSNEVFQIDRIVKVRPATIRKVYQKLLSYGVRVYFYHGTKNTKKANDVFMKLIAIDMDGTLLSSDGSISDENLQAILEVKKQGHHIAICSGRYHDDILHILKPYKLHLPIISGNGSSIYDNGFLKQLFLDKQTVLEIINALRQYEIPVELYTDQGIFMEKDTKSFLYNEIDELAKSSSAIDKDYIGVPSILNNPHIANLNHSST